MSKRLHDALFKLVFKMPSCAGALLRELVPKAVRVAVAWETLDCKSGSFVDAEFTDRHSDLLFSARLRKCKSKFIYFLLEHQSTNDPKMPLRVLTYHNQIWNRFAEERPKARLPPIVAVLVSHVRGGWRVARDFEELFDPTMMALSGLAALVPRFSMVVEDLTQLSDGDLVARSLGAFPKLALWLLRDARAPARLLGSFEFWIPSMVELGRTRSGLDRLKVLITYMFQVIDPMHLTELRAKFRELDLRSRKVAMSIAEYLHKKGLEEGRKKGHKKGLEEGRRRGLEKGHKKGLREGRRKGLEEGVEKGRKRGLEEGVKQGRIAMLRSLLVLKFHRLGAENEARLQAATPEAIDRYLRRLLTADSLAAVFKG